MRILINVVNSEPYEVEKGKDYETVILEIYLAQKDKSFYEFKDIDNRRVTLNVNYIVSVVEQGEEYKMKPIGIQAIPRKP